MGPAPGSEKRAEEDDAPKAPAQENHGMSEDKRPPKEADPTVSGASTQNELGSGSRSEPSGSGEEQGAPRSILRPLEILRGDARKSRGGQLNQLGRKDASAGLTFGVTMVLFTLGGHWLDGYLETSPLFLILGAALGGVSGFIYLVETVSPGTLFSARKDLARKQAEAMKQKTGGAQQSAAGRFEGEEDEQ